MKYVGYYNGKIGPLEEMSVPMNDRAVYFGDGVYEATLISNGVPFALEEHFERFFSSLRLLRIDNFNMSREELKSELMRCVDALDEGDDVSMLYWQCSRGTDYRHHSFPDSLVKPNLMAMVTPYDKPSLGSKIKLIMVEDTRFLHCNIKTLNLIPSVMANQRAMEEGCNEAVFHRGDIVTECAHSNLLIIKDGVLRTHPTNSLILPGITRKHLLELARENGVGTDETAFTIDEMMAADEILVSSSGSLCGVAEAIDGKPVGRKAAEIVDTLCRAYNEKFDKYTGRI